MAEIQATNLADAASAISAMLAPEEGQAQVGETQSAEESEEDLEAAASEDDESGVEDAPDEETSEEQSGEEEEQEEQEQPQTFTVKVDGKEVAVTLDELQKGYSRTQDYTRKTQQIAEVRKQVEAETQAVRAERGQYAQLLGALQAQLQASEPQVDLDRLYNEDPIEWVRQKEVLRERQEKAYAIQAEQQRLIQLSQQEQQQSMQQHLESQKDALLAALPEWKDPKKAKLEKAMLIESAKSAGFSDEDLKSVYDHRLVLLLRKAALFDQMVSKRQGIKPVVNNGPRPAKPGAAGRVSATSEATRAKQRLIQLSQQEQQQSMQQHLESQKDALLAALPEWKDPKKAKLEKAMLIESAKSAGFSDEDLKSVYDHRLVLLLRKAALFDQMVSKRQGIKPVTNNGPRPAKPGAAGRVSTTSEVTRAQQRLAKTGRVDDAADAIYKLLR